MRLGETSCQLGNVISGFSGGEKINQFLGSLLYLLNY